MEEVLNDLKTIKSESKLVGLDLNFKKCEIFYHGYDEIDVKAKSQRSPLESYFHHQLNSNSSAAYHRGSHPRSLQLRKSEVFHNGRKN